ncbi:stage V sporulation protein AE [Aneurinibacillus sp. Ricciae_BoGa-3]|uniref:stage V sporulation protein AE n=1 Tax=Aneurinibacillus sp. Ricciae_BoGa-3 TaxID=3022697 RepID=UPI00234063F3|nr:stage V sporulation protein AE [Aneurinibacillus sp. Ricciae_BoGa-3]WCK56005.1 stage V sporulation protein AE [Aneurinibacillus sp. Ricciae_BoGa-3]
MQQKKKRKIIIVTDGDCVARRTLEGIARKIGGQCISRGAGNPTPLTGPQIVSLIRKAECDPVLVMFDDNGNARMGRAEEALYHVSTHPDIEVLGAIAVASQTQGALGVQVDICIDRFGREVRGQVNKSGIVIPGDTCWIVGDTVDVLNMLKLPYIVGIGDIGKMRGKEDRYNGCPVTLRAVEVILARSGYIPRI